MFLTIALCSVPLNSFAMLPHICHIDSKNMIIIQCHIIQYNSRGLGVFFFFFFFFKFSYVCRHSIVMHGYSRCRLRHNVRNSIQLNMDTPRPSYWVSHSWDCTAFWDLRVDGSSLLWGMINRNGRIPSFRCRRKPESPEKTFKVKVKVGVESPNQTHIQPLDRWISERKGKCSSTKPTRFATAEVVCHPDTEQTRPYKIPLPAGNWTGDQYCTASENFTSVQQHLCTAEASTFSR